MKWLLILVNVAAVAGFLALRQYAHGFHRVQVESAYRALVNGGLFDEPRAAEFARTHNGVHPRQWLQQISNPNGFVNVLVLAAVAVCLVNSGAALLFMRRGIRIAEPGAAVDGGRARRFQLNPQGPPPLS